VSKSSSVSVVLSVCCSALKCVVVCCSKLQYVRVCYSVCVAFAISSVSVVRKKDPWLGPNHSCIRILSNPRYPPPLVPHFTRSFSWFPVLFPWICRWLTTIGGKMPLTSLALFRGFLCALSLFVVGSFDPHFTRSCSWIPLLFLRQ